MSESYKSDTFAGFPCGVLQGIPHAVGLRFFMLGAFSAATITMSSQVIHIGLLAGVSYAVIVLILWSRLAKQGQAGSNGLKLFIPPVLAFTIPADSVSASLPGDGLYCICDCSPASRCAGRKRGTLRRE